MQRPRKIASQLVKGVFRFATAKVVFSFVIIVFAATVSVTSRNSQAEFGSTLIVANDLIATDKGFSLALTGLSAAGASCSSPITFGLVPGTANTAITISHLVYDVQVNSTSSAPANTKYNVTLQLAQTTYGPLCIQTPALPVLGQIIDCKFDIGTSLPASPYSFKVTVQ